MAHTGNLGDLIDRSRDLDKVALIDLLEEARPRQVTYRELDAEADAVARALVARGIRRGERVAILAVNRTEFLAAYLGIMRAGMVAVPVNHKFPRETIGFILADCDAKLVFADAERAPMAPAHLPLVSFDDAGPHGYAAFLDQGPFETVRPAKDEIAMFLYTSGSTGRPKGVPLTHFGHLWVVRTRGRGADVSGHRFLVAAPLYHMNALAISKYALWSHAAIVLMPQFKAPAYLRAIANHKATWLTSVPTMLALILQEKALLAELDLSSVKVVAMGSAPATQALLDNIRATFKGCRIAYGYGTTEAGPTSFGPHPKGIPTPDLCVGYPLQDPEVRVRLVDGDNYDADQGVLHQDNPARMPGYHNMPEKTAEVITPDGYYITGDVFRRDENGFYYFVGRADDMFVCSGENIYPGEVEKMLERHPAIEQACVVPVADEIRGQKPSAFIVPAKGATITEREVKDYALAHAPAYQHPRHVEFMEELPLASTNKIDRKALTERARKWEA